MDSSDLPGTLSCADADPATPQAAGLHAIFQALACGVVVQDHSGRIVECNPAAEHLLGLQRSQLMGAKSIDPRWRALDGNGHDLPGDRHPAMHTLRTGEPVSQFEMGVCLPSGERRWITVNTRPLAVAGRTWAVATFEEATARRNLAHTLSERWQRLSATLAGTGTWELHIGSGMLRPNPRWAEIAGWRLADLAEAAPLSLHTWMDQLHPDDRATCHDRLQAHCAGTLEVFECEVRVRHRDGSWRWVRDHGRIAGPARTVEAEWMFGTREDITTRKQAELAAHHALAMLKGLFELMPVGISLVDTGTGRATDINDALCRMVGHSREELMQMDLSQFTPPELRAHRAELFRIALETGHSDPCESVLLHRSGRPVPVLRSGARVDSPEGRPHVWSVVQDISALKTLEQQLRAAATQDRLTGLPNRAALTQQLEALAAQARTDPACCFAVLFLDFDRFKLVNDTLGHTAGDELLRQIADRLRALLADTQFSQPGWTVGRLGGDEFVLLAPGLATPQAAKDLARALCERLAAPYLLQGREIHSSASVGVALSRGARTDADAMMREADTAMYAAKHAGRGSLRLFDDAMHAQLTRSVMIENALRQAHLRGEMQVVYQPIVDLASGRLSSVEALLRWRHPELGQVSPAEFIPVAEECGAIIELGDWVLRQACEQAAAWQRHDPRHAPATVSVNLSRLQLTLGQVLVDTVRSALADSGLPATALQLEITEREVTKQATGTLGLMKTLHGLGVKLAMDDFGTGASSLGFLRDFPFDAIKIDKSFVTDLCSDPNVLAVAHATIQLVENLGMVSVAEGIEDPAELAMLQSLGCRLGQGYLFGRPVPAEALMAGLRVAGAASG